MGFSCNFKACYKKEYYFHVHNTWKISNTLSKMIYMYCSTLPRIVSIYKTRLLFFIYNDHSYNTLYVNYHRGCYSTYETNQFVSLTLSIPQTHSHIEGKYHYAVFDAYQSIVCRSKVSLTRVYHCRLVTQAIFADTNTCHLVLLLCSFAGNPET